VDSCLREILLALRVTNPVRAMQRRRAVRLAASPAFAAVLCVARDIELAAVRVIPVAVAPPGGTGDDLASACDALGARHVRGRLAIEVRAAVNARNAKLAALLVSRGARKAAARPVTSGHAMLRPIRTCRARDAAGRGVRVAHARGATQVVA